MKTMAAASELVKTGEVDSLRVQWQRSERRKGRSERLQADIKQQYTLDKTQKNE
jgi:hypothetical protein